MSLRSFVTNFAATWRKTSADLDCYSAALDVFYIEMGVAHQRHQTVSKDSANVPIFLARAAPRAGVKTLFTDGLSGFVLSARDGGRMRVELSLTMDAGEPDSWQWILEGIALRLLERREAPFWGEIFDFSCDSSRDKCGEICAAVRPGLWFEVSKTAFESCGTAFGLAEVLLLSRDEAARFRDDEEAAELWFKRMDIDVSSPSRLLK